MNFERKYNSNSSIFLLVLIFWLLFLNQTLTIARNDTALFDKGRVIDTVLCKRHPGFSYALYLPGYYTNAMKWPIIYIFDPGARGTLGVNSFRQVGEKYGYILVCSNNSRNGDWDKIVEAANNMFEDVEDRFPLDTNRIYTSGFSGGSRVAAYVAQMNKRIAGVIGCGAGFPSNQEIQSTEPASYVYMGLVGDRDMNYLEMLQLEQKLNSLGVTVNLRTFDDGHKWPSPELIQEAVEWLELEAMKKGIRQKDNFFVRAQLEKRREQAIWFEKQGDLIEFAKYLRYIIRDFSDQPEILNYQKELDSLEKSKDYKKAVKEWDKIRMQESNSQGIFFNAINNAVRIELLSDSVRYWWKREIRNLRKMETGNDKNKQLMASRLLSYLMGAAGSMPIRGFVNANQYSKAIVLLQINTIIQPENLQFYYSLAHVYALKKESKEALNALEKAIELGLKNKLRVQNDPAFAYLKDDERYKTLITRLQ